MNVKLFRKSSQCFLFLMLVNMVFLNHFAAAQKQIIKSDITELDEKVIPIFQSPAFIQLQWPTIKHLEINNTIFQLPDENPLHDEGVFQIKNLNAVIYSIEPLRISCQRGNLDVRIIANDSKSLDQSVCEKIAFDFLSKNFNWFFTGKNINASRSRFAKGIWNFDFEKADVEGLPAAHVMADVRAIDGKIVSFTGSKRVGDWPAHRLSPDQVTAIAIKIAKQDKGFINFERTGIYLGSNGNNPSAYSVVIKATRLDDDLTYSGYIYIDGNTGKAYEKQSVSWSESENSTAVIDNGVRPQVVDSWPTWTENGLAFRSNRSLQGLPDWAEYPSQTMLLNSKDNALYYLTCDWSTDSYGSSQLSSNWLSINRKYWKYNLNLANGKYRTIATPIRPGESLTNNLTGTLAIMSGRGSEIGSTHDLFLMKFSDQAHENSMIRNRLVLDGDQRLGAVSPNNKSLFCITESKGKDGITRSLDQISIAELGPKGPTLIPNQNVFTVVHNLPYINRLSVFLNGERLLLQASDGILVVNIPNSSVVRLKLDNLRDAEVKSPIVELRGSCAGPTDDRVTFSGKTIDKEGNVRRRIYSCRFDGSDLKAHTPKENTPVPMYKFPGSEKTAYDVAKEWALNEIKWEDEHRQSN